MTSISRYTLNWAMYKLLEAYLKLSISKNILNILRINLCDHIVFQIILKNAMLSILVVVGFAEFAKLLYML